MLINEENLTMKINIEKQTLVSALKKVVNVISAKSTLPVISNILMIAKDNQLTLITTDLKLTVKTTVATEVIEEGSTTIPCKKFNEIIQKLPNNEIIFTSDENFKNEVFSGNSKFKIPGLDPKEFPIVEEEAESRAFQIKSEFIIKSLKKISYAASTDDARYVLNGILFSIRDGLLTTVATDGRRLALVGDIRINDVETDIDGDAVLPMKAISEVIKSIEDSEYVTVNFSDTQTSFKTANSIVITKLIDGNYPNFRHVIPTELQHTMTVSRTDLMAALDRVSLVISDSNLSVNILIDETKIELKALSPELGEAHEVIPASYTGTPLEITFNPKFLADPLKHLECDNLIAQLNDKSRPVILTGDEGFQYVIMPMRG